MNFNYNFSGSGYTSPNVSTDYSDRPRKPQVMKTVTVETFGEEYPEPEKL